VFVYHWTRRYFSIVRNSAQSSADDDQSAGVVLELAGGHAGVPGFVVNGVLGHTINPES
jgi:hypothetical protein